MPAFGTPASSGVERRPDALGEDRLGTPQAGEPVDLRLEQPEGGVGRLGRPGDRRAERREPLERGLEVGSISLRLGVEERRFRRQPVRRPERHPAPDAERPRGGVRVEDGPVRPRLPAEDDRPRRPRAGGLAPPREIEEQVRAMEMEESHGSVSRALGRGLVRPVDLAASRRCDLRRACSRAWSALARPPRPRLALRPAEPAEVLCRSSSRSDRRRQASRSPPSAYRSSSVARRPGGPARLRATSTSVRCPTTSRPSRIHDRRASSSRMPVASPTAPTRPPDLPAPPLGGSSTTRLMPARRASAATRARRSAKPAARASPPGRSMTSRSTARPDSSEPAIARPSSRIGRGHDDEPLRARRRAPRPRPGRAPPRGPARRRSRRPPGPPPRAAGRASSARSRRRPAARCPSRAARRRARGSRRARRSPSRRRGSGPSCGSATGERSGTVASAPMTSPTAPSIDDPLDPEAPSTPGAAAPQRDRRVARAALRSGEGAVIADSIEQMFE